MSVTYLDELVVGKGVTYLDEEVTTPISDVAIDESPFQVPQMKLGVIPEAPPEHPIIMTRTPDQWYARDQANQKELAYKKRIAENKAKLEHDIAAGYPVNPEAAAFYGVDLPEAPKPKKEKVPKGIYTGEQTAQMEQVVATEQPRTFTQDTRTPISLDELPGAQDYALNPVRPTSPTETDMMVETLRNVPEATERTAGSAISGLALSALNAAKGITGLNEKVTPKFIKNIKDNIGYTALEDRVKDKVDNLITDLSVYRQQMQNEIRKDGGVAAEVAQGIGDSALNTAVMLASLGVTGFTGAGATVRAAVAEAGKFGALMAATTPGTAADRIQAGAHAAVMMLMPIPLAKLPATWMSVTANIVGLNILSKLAGDFSVERAKEKAITNGNPEEWVGELLAEGIPSFVINGVFGSLVKSAKQGKAEAQAQLASIPIEIIDNIKQVNPKGYAEWQKRVGIEETKKGVDIQVEQTPRQLDVLASKGEIPLEAPQKPLTVAETPSKVAIAPEPDIVAPPAEIGVKVPLEPVKTTEGIPGQLPELIKPEKITVGEPITLEAYHGTRESFTSFDEQQARKNTPSLSGQMLMFVDDFKEAKFYTEKTDNDGNIRNGDSPRIIKTQLNIKNPLVIKTKENPTNYYDINEQKLLRQIDEGEHDGIIVEGLFDGKPQRVIAVPSGKQAKIINETLPPSTQPQQPSQGEPNAIQKPIPETIPLRQPPPDGEAVAKGNAEVQGVAGETKPKAQGKVAEVKPVLTKMESAIAEAETIIPSKEEWSAFGSDQIKVDMAIKRIAKKHGVDETELRKNVLWQAEVPPPDAELSTVERQMQAVGLEPKTGKPITEPTTIEPAKPPAEPVRNATEIKPYKVELNEKDLITKPLSEIQKSAKAMDIPTENRTRKDVVDDIKTKQDETQKEKLIDEMPIDNELKKGLRNLGGAVGFTKQAKVEPTSQNKEAVDMQRVFDQQRQDVEKKFKVTGSKILDEYLKKITAADAPFIRRISKLQGGQKVVMDKVLSTGWAEKQSEDYGIVKKYIKEKLPYRFYNAFDDYLQARRTIEVSKLMRENRGVQPELFAAGELPDVIKSPGGKGEKSNQMWIDEFKRTHTPEEFKALEESAKRWDKTLKTVRDEYLQEGLIDKEYYDYLEKFHRAYSPRRFIQHIDPPTEINQGGKVMSISSSGLEALDVGSEKSLINNSDYLLGRILSIKEARIFKNRSNKSLYDFASASKDNPLGIKIETPQQAKNPPSSDMTRISVMIDGKPQTLVGPTELMNSWIQTNPQLNAQTASIIQWLMGGKIVRPLATGYSPFFALRNPFRDFSHYWFVTDEWSPHKPLAWAQQSKDIKDVWSDVMHEGKLVKLYFATGGGTSFMSSQGRLGRSAVGTSEIRNDAVDQVEGVLAWLPRRSEILGRVALMNRAIKNRAKKNNLTYEQALQNKDIVKEAVYIAKTAMDFSQGGTLVKTLDNFKPYLNAGVQASRTSFNAYRNRPIQTIYKSAQVIAFSAAQQIAKIYLAKYLADETKEKLRKIPDFQKCMDSISDTEEVGNYTFPTPFYKMDANGRKRYFYLRIPCEQTQQIFKVIGEESAKAFMTGEKPNYKKLAQAFSNFSPMDVQTLLPPTMAVVMGYASNKDFWRGQDIWQGRSVPPSVEYDVDTPTGWKLTGKVTGLSPKRMQKSIQNLIPQNDYISVFTGVTSAMQLANDDTLNQKMWTLLTRTPGLRAFFKVTQPTDLTEDDIKKARKYDIPTEYADGDTMPRQVIMKKINEKELDENTERQLNDVHLDILVGQVKRKEIKKEEISKWIDSLEISASNQDIVLLNPVSAIMVEKHGIKLPEGYVKKGDKYIFKTNSSVPVVDKITESDKIGEEIKRLYDRMKDKNPTLL